jgi:hypothetical protein
MHRRLESSPTPAVDDPSFTRARKQRVVQEGIERLDGFRRGLAVQIQITCYVLSATCYVLSPTCDVLTCDVLTGTVPTRYVITGSVITCYVLSAMRYGHAASWLRRLQVGGGHDDGTPLQLDEQPPAVAHFAHDACAESRDVHAIARGEDRHQLRSIARAPDAR